MNQTPIIYSFRLDSVGGATELTPESDSAIRQAIASSELTWFHINTLHPDAEQFLLEIMQLDALVSEALLADETRPRLVDNENTALIILRGVNLNQGAEPEDMVSLRIWITKNSIISAGRRPLKALRDIVESFTQNKGPKDAGEWLTDVCVELYDHMQSAVTGLVEETDKLEEEVFHSQNENVRESILDIRKRAMILRRYITPQKDVVSYLRESQLSWMNDFCRRRLIEVGDWLTRYCEDLDSVRERAQVIKDELNAAMNDRLNRNLYLLSIVAAVALPLGILTGLFGINIGGMPGVESPHAFIWFSIALVVLCLLELVYLKKKKWI
ncbi:zinc transporter ZntB [Hahella sp. CCB-MM4]|uniref:zinc transporter ZntB n=1 Tax=Hahella sp. (strain CCB-MM4) TaxID=1926491 RepID=UPI000B9B5F8A|nr:zinc transporter ZntB [Hahella sp. CCB-MM4]OZG74473.1 zinc transporter ZntB [Hahella sp. CCB-MM4]